MDKPAILGGKPVFEKLLPITRPYLPGYDKIEQNTKEMFASGIITNDKYVRQFEASAQNYLGAKNCVAVSSCTSGLMLSQKAMKLTGEVILPSFTFFATGHSILWNNLKPVFVDIDPETYHLDPKLVNEAITEKTCAILPVHIYGCPAPATEFEEIAEDHKIKLFFDSAHAFGAKIGKRHVGTFGDVEVFSCSPTKLMVTGEGGLCATKDDELKRKLSAGRNYGDSGSYDCELLGLNARMGEFNAILGIETIKLTEENIEKRAKLFEIYRRELSRLPGIRFQKVAANMRVTHKDVPLYIDSEEFGLSRDHLQKALDRENIMTKKYFYPPLHRQMLYKEYFEEFDKKLPETNRVSGNILSIPLYSAMSEEEARLVADAIKRIHEHRDSVKNEKSSSIH
ncbi:DegT/DnrJ/EryC1/StrS family aminotransferase [Candidatus Woesearchaeota archaeon]|nr:DegT/DnrJ/EryC1/StrS family aminotransferase [Candidatus Woesearchaeota archaeon]